MKFFTFRNISMLAGIFFAIAWLFLPRGSLAFVFSQMFRGRTSCGRSAKLGADALIQEMTKTVNECDPDEELRINVSISKAEAGE